MLTTKKCNGCDIEKPISDFYKKWKNGRQYSRSSCKQCFNSSFNRNKVNERKRGYRSDEALRANHICTDAKSSDKKHGRDYDLNVEFVSDLIAKPCSYCADTSSRMTLDRIDNSKGHTKENVVPACYRCNMIKGNMPYEAWQFMIDGVKSARLANAFGEWGKRPISKRNTDM